MNILRGGDPKVLRALETVDVLGEQQPILVAPHDIRVCGHVLHDVEAVEDDLGGGQRNGFESGINVGLPHIHRDCLDPCELLRGAGLVECSQTRLFPAFRNELDGPAVHVVDDGQIPMTFAERLLIDADAGDGGRLFVGQPAGDGSLKHGLSLIPGDTDERACSLRVLAGLEEIDHETFHDQGEAAMGLRPRHLDLALLCAPGTRPVGHGHGPVSGTRSC